MKRFFLKVTALMMVLLCCLGVDVKAESVTVNDGTSTNLYVPLYGYYADTSGKSQFVISSSDISDVANGSITGLSFYAASDFSFTGTWEVRLMETTESAVSSAFLDVTDATLVYTGQISISSGVASITFDDAFAYEGQNLLIEISLKTTGNCSTSSAPVWYGVSSGTSRGGSGASPSLRSFLPKTTLEYTPGAAGACPKPSVPILSNLTSSSADFTWTAGGEEKEWKVICIPATATPDWDNDAELLSAASKSVSGLTANTAYVFYLRAVCDDEESGERAVSFKTECGNAILPWSEGFENYDGGTYSSGSIIPDCWEHYSTNSVLPHVIGSGSYHYTHTGSKALTFYGNGSNYAALPIFAAPINTLQISFWMQVENASNGTLTLGYITSDDVNFNTFQPISSFESSAGSMALRELDLNDVPAEAYRLVFHWVYTSQYSCCIDDITIRLIPNCKKLNSIAVSSISANGVDFVWEPKGDETQWQYVVVPAEDTPDWNDATLVSDQFASISDGLISNTQYKAYVRAYCSADEQGDSIFVAFKTDCDPDAPHLDDLEGETDCWRFGNIQAPNNSSYIPSIYEGYAHSTSHSLKLNAYKSISTPADSAYAIVPAVDFGAAGIQGYRLKFWGRQYSTGTGYYNKLLVGVLSDPANFNTFTLVSEVEFTGGTTYTEYEVSFAAYSGEGSRIVILAIVDPSSTADYRYAQFYLDDIEVALLPTCSKPTDLIVSDITATAATFSWSPGADEELWQYFIAPNGTDPNWDEAGLIDENPFTSEEPLDEHTDYVFYLRSYCDDEAQSDITFIPFSTICKIKNLPYQEGFEDGSDCWTMGNMQNESSSYIPSVGTSYKHSGDNGLRLYAYYNSGYYSTTNADSAYAVLPEMNFEDGIAKYSMSLYAKTTSMSSGYNTHLYVGVVESPEDLSTFVQVADLELTTNFAQKEFTFTAYAGNGKYIVLLATIPSGSASTRYGSFYIDDIEIFKTPSCQPLASISVSDIERRSMVVSLNPKEGRELAASYELVFSKSELDETALDAADKIEVNDTNAYRISSLDRETLYLIYARANCGSEDGVSAWVHTSATTKGLNECDALQVGDGTETANLVYTSYGNTYSQHIYTADELIAAGYKKGSISSISFNYSGTSSSYDKTQSVYIGTTALSAFAGYAASDFIGDLTLAYGPTELSYQRGWREYAVSSPFEWDGVSNIVVGMLTNSTATTASGWSSYGTAIGATRSIYRYRDSSPIDITDLSAVSYGNSSTTRPNIMFSFCYTLDACPVVNNLAAEILGSGATEEKLTWEAPEADFLSGYQFILSDSAIVDFSAIEQEKIVDIAADVVSYELHALTPSTQYFAYLRAVCKAESHDDGESDWASVEFTTLANCPAVIDLAANLIDLNAARISWNPANEEQDTTFYYILSDVKLDAEGLDLVMADRVQADSLYVDINGLLNSTDYWVYVASKCGETVSAWDTIAFTTMSSCPKVVNLVAEPAHNLVKLSWDKAQFAKEILWEVGILGEEAKDTVDMPAAEFYGLQAETAYKAYVIALCSDIDNSDSVYVDFTTAAVETCQEFATGTSAISYTPLYSNYGGEYSVIIYTADELLAAGFSAGKIEGISFHLKSIGDASTANKYQKTASVWMMNTEKASFASNSDWITEGLAQVKNASVVDFKPAESWIQLTFDNAFEWDGTSNIAVATLLVSTGSYTTHTFYGGTTSDNRVIYGYSDETSLAVSGGVPNVSYDYNKKISKERPNIQFCFEQKACPNVVALSVSDITVDGAVVTWTPMGMEKSWRRFTSDSLVVDYGAIPLSVIDTVQAAKLVYSGLLDDQDYHVYIQPICDGAEGWGHVSFTTVASCLSMASPSVIADSTKAHSARVCWIDPNEVPAGKYIVVYDKFDDFDLNNTEIAKVQVTDTFADLTNLQADTVYRFAVIADCGTTAEPDRSRFSAIAEFATLKSCFVPTNPDTVGGSVTTNQAIVYWRDDHDDAAYIVAYGLSASFDIDNPETYQTINVEDTFAVLPNLQPALQYSFCVKGDCSSVGEGLSREWTASKLFATECEPISALPWQENFESYSEYSTSTRWTQICWQNFQVQAKTGSSGSSDLGFRINTTAQGDNATVKLCLPDMGSGEITQLTLPEMNIPAANAYEFFIDVYRNATGTSYPEEGLRVLAIHGLDTTELGFISRNCSQTDTIESVEVVPAETAAGWYTYNFILPYSGNMNIVVQGESKWGSATYFDNLLVREIPSCKKPSSINNPSDITASSASITWEAGEAETQWQYAVAIHGEDPIWSNENIVNERSASLSELLANTEYDFYVRSSCGVDSHSDSIFTSFRTLCAAIAAFPWSEGFEDGIDCWTVGNRQSTSATYIPSTGTSYKHSGDNGLRLNAYHYGYTPTLADSAYAVLPEMNFEDGIAKYSMSIYAKTTSTSSGYNTHLYVGVVESPEDLSTFVQVADFELTTNFAQKEFSFAAYEGSGKYIVLLATVPSSHSSSYTQYYGSFYVDDIEVFKTPTCQPLASISVSDIERRSMVVTLNPKEGRDLASSHELVFSKSELDETALDAADKIEVNDTNAYRISSLERNTKYYIYVRANCGLEDGVSTWVSASATTKTLDADCSSSEDKILRTGDGNATVDFVLWGSYYNRTHSQQIYTASELAAAGLSAGYIGKVAFQYAYTSAYSKTVTLYMGTTSSSSFASTSFLSLNQVSEATPINFSTQGEWYEIELGEPFYWDGVSNIVVGAMSRGTNYTSSGTKQFYGSTTTEYMSLYDRADSSDPSMVTGTRTQNRADVRFTMCPLASECPAVTGLTSELPGDGTSEAIVRWNRPDADYLGSYEAILSETEISDLSGAVATHTGIVDDSIKFEGLTSSTDYYVYVRAICNAESHDDGQSVWSDAIHFKTLANCPAPVAPVATLMDEDSVRIEWGLAFVDQDKSFQFYLSNEELTEEQILSINGMLPINDTLAIALGHLNHSADYYFYIRSVCGSEYSSFAMAEFSTLPACQAVINLTATNVAHNMIELSWASAQFATETQWEVGLVGHESDAQIVGERSAKILGLTPETDYEVYVKAICSSTESSEGQTLSLTTAAAPGACVSVGNGTSTGNMPVTNYDYAYTQMIYDAALIGQSGNIMSLQLKRSTYANEMSNMKVYLGTTDKAIFASNSDWVPESDLTLVYDGDFLAGTASAPNLDLELIAPFAYDGSSNLVVAISNGNGNWNSIQNFYYTSVANTVLYNRADNDASYALHPGTAEGQSPTNSRTNIEFCFEPKACPDVTALLVSNISAHGADISWTPMGSELAWNVFVSDTVVVDFSVIAPATENVLSHSFAGLLSEHTYYAYVQPACGGDDWKSVSFTTLVSCIAPTSIAVDPAYITSNSASINWSDINENPAGSYIVAYGIAASFDLSDESTYQTKPTSGLQVELDDLAANTLYSVAVKADCGSDDGESSYSSSISFRTECAAFALPFFEDFEGDINCWTLSECHSATGVSTAKPYEGSQSFRFRYNTNPPQYLISPEFVETSKDVEISFYYISYNSSNIESFKVGHSETDNSIASFTWSDEILVDDPDNWAQYIDTISVGVKYIAIQYTANNKYYLYIDNISLKEVEKAPTAIEDAILKGEGVQKVIINDHLFIIREGKLFDATGRLVEEQR